MSGGLYSMEEKDFDRTLDLAKVKPYGDTMNDGKIQLSFTLPVPIGAEAEEAAKLLLKEMGLQNPMVVFSKELTNGFTFFNCYGNCSHTVDYSNIYVPKVETTTWDMPQTDDFIRTNIGRPIRINPHSVSIGTRARSYNADRTTYIRTNKIIRLAHIPSGSFYFRNINIRVVYRVTTVAIAVEESKSIGKFLRENYHGVLQTHFFE